MPPFAKPEHRSREYAANSSTFGPPGESTEVRPPAALGLRASAPCSPSPHREEAGFACRATPRAKPPWRNLYAASVRVRRQYAEQDTAGGGLPPRGPCPTAHLAPMA